MSGKGDRRLNLDWVSVRYRSVVMLVVTTLGLVAAGWLTWSYYQGQNSPQLLASRGIEAAEVLYEEARGYGESAEVTPIRNKAREHLAEGRKLYSEERFEEARIKSILSRNNSQKVIDIARSADTTRTEVTFYKIDGDVKVKRAGSLLWDPADPDAPLRVGDAIKTSSRGSAKIIYFDGSMTTVKPGSLVEITALRTDPVTRQVQVTESLKVGGVRAVTFGAKAKGSFHEVTTNNSVSRSATDQAGDFEVDFDAESAATQVSVHNGEAFLSSGEKSVILGAAERIEVSGQGQFGARQALLPPPRQLAPGNHKIFVTETGELSRADIVWSEVPGARSYRLEVSRHGLMTDLTHQPSLRNATQMALEDLEEGSWFWRVAAIDSKGEVGSYSEISEFKVAGPGSNLTEDNRPPLLEISEFLQTGSMVIINGRTESDANLWVDNLQVDVYEDGSFTAVVRLHRDGANQLEILAQDPAGNETVTRREAFLEVF